MASVRQRTEQRSLLLSPFTRPPHVSFITLAIWAVVVLPLLSPVIRYSACSHILFVILALCKIACWPFQ